MEKMTRHEKKRFYEQLIELYYKDIRELSEDLYEKYDMIVSRNYSDNCSDYRNFKESKLPAIEHGMLRSLLNIDQNEEMNEETKKRNKAILIEKYYDIYIKTKEDISYIITQCVYERIGYRTRDVHERVHKYNPYKKMTYKK